LLITQDILADPHIRDKLIYVHPARTDYVIPFNVLVTRAEHPYDIAATVLEAFRRTWPECLSEAPHFSNSESSLFSFDENTGGRYNRYRPSVNLQKITDGGREWAKKQR
jgi:hypothetical protein